MAEVVAKVDVKKEPGYLYFLDKNGNIARVPAKKKWLELNCGEYAPHVLLLQKELINKEKEILKKLLNSDDSDDIEFSRDIDDLGLWYRDDSDKLIRVIAVLDREEEKTVDFWYDSDNSEMRELVEKYSDIVKAVNINSGLKSRHEITVKAGKQYTVIRHGYRDGEIVIYSERYREFCRDYRELLEKKRKAVFLEEVRELGDAWIGRLSSDYRNDTPLTNSGWLEVKRFYGGQRLYVRRDLKELENNGVIVMK